MSFRPALRILLSLAIILIATFDGGHGSFHAEAAPIAATKTAPAVRASDGRCGPTAQSHCHVLAIASEHTVLTNAGSVLCAGLLIFDDHDRSKLALPLEEEPPRLV